MPNSGDAEPAAAGKSKPPAGSPAPPPPQAATDVENQDPSLSSSPAVSSIVERWRREDLLKKGTFILRGSALVFSMLAMVVMASNDHGGWKNFDKYEEYRYCLAISILAFLYSGAQILRQTHRISTGKDVISQERSGFLDFLGDQIAAYLLISALSSAASLTNRLREGSDNLFTDASSASISMAFFAFTSLALSALISGFRLSNQTYI